MKERMNQFISNREMKGRKEKDEGKDEGKDELIYINKRNEGKDAGKDEGKEWINYIERMKERMKERNELIIERMKERMNQFISKREMKERKGRRKRWINLFRIEKWRKG